VKTWCAACSTGEEAYSLALACHDFRMRHGLERDFRIYATDLKAASPEEAKRGIYPNAALSEIPPRYRRPELLIAKGSTFEIDPLLRRQVVFSRHDMVKDQPFPQCDLIVCRNALIYYNQETQKLLLDRFSGALRPGGVLFLGAPEVSTAHGSAFRPMRGTSRFLENTREERVDETESAALLPHSVREKPMQGPRLSLTRQDGVASLVMVEMPDILRHLGAAVFVLNEEGEIQRTFGDYERFIEMPRSRTFTSNLLDLLPDPLSVNVALLMRKAAAAGKARMPAMDPGGHPPSRQVEGLCHITSSSDDQTTYILTLNVLPDPAHSLSGLDADASTGGHDTMDDVLLKAEIASLHDKLAETVQDLQDIYAERQVMKARLLVAETELAERHEEIGNLTEELQVARSGSDGPANYAGFLFGEVADVLTQLDLGMALVDRQLRLSQFNGAFAELLSLDEKDIGRQMDEVILHVPQADRLAFNAALLQSALHDKPAAFVFEGRDGVRYRMNGRPLSDRTTMGDGVVLLVGPILS
jgi:two-component system CheB/CheR fusion protein